MAFQSSLLSIQRKCIRVGSTNRCRQTDCAFLYSPSLACFPDSSAGKESACNAGDSILVFWPGEFHELYRPWGRKEQDKTEQLSVPSLTPSYCFGLTFIVYLLHRRHMDLKELESLYSFQWLKLNL